MRETILNQEKRIFLFYNFINSCRSTHNCIKSFFFLTGTTLAQYGDELYLIMPWAIRSSVISLIITRSDHAKRLGVYTDGRLSKRFSLNIDLEWELLFYSPLHGISKLNFV